MKRLSVSIGILLLLTGLAVGSYMAYQYHQKQRQLATLLQQLDFLLSARNDASAREASNALRGIEANVLKNQRQPSEAVTFQRAKALETAINTLVDTIRSYRDGLRHADNFRTPILSPYLSALGGVTGLLGPGTRRNIFLRQQTAACIDTIRQLNGSDTSRMTLPNFDRMPTAVALASLSGLEHRLLARELAVFRHLSKPLQVQALRAGRLSIRFIPAASAQWTTATPGSTYKGSLLLVRSIAEVERTMYCNGHPIPVGADGVGTVRFRAPSKPGPAAWLATIRVKTDGHDSIFQLQVPYRVAQR